MRKLPAILLAVLPLLFAAAAWAADTPIQSGTFDSAGVRISYIEAGTGQPVVLVHGLYSSAQINWVLPGTFKMLAPHYHVIALDLRGHGASAKPADEAAYGQPMVEDVVGLMDHLKIKQAHIAGYSLGGIIVMKLMIDHPERVLSGTLGGMGWLREGSFEQRIFERLGDRESRPGTTPPACVHGIAKLAVTAAQVKQVKAPMTILIGDHDPCRVMYVQPLQPLRPDWPVVVIPNAGHLNCITKEPFQTELAKWIAAHAP